MKASFPSSSFSELNSSNNDASANSSSVGAETWTTEGCPVLLIDVVARLCWPMTDSAAADELMDRLGKGGVVGGCAIIADPRAIVADPDADSDCTECEEAGRDAVPAATVAFLLASGSAMTVGMVVLCWYGGGGGRRRFYWVDGMEYGTDSLRPE